MDNKESKEEIQARVDRIYHLLLLGMRPREIWRSLSENTKNPYTQPFRVFERDLLKARALLEKDAAPQRKEALSRNKARLEWLFMKSASIQDYKGALAAVREMNELLGLHKPEPKRKQQGKVM